MQAALAWWFGAAQERKRVSTQLRRLGVSEDQLAGALEDLPPEENELAAENVPAMTAFARVSTQWRYRGASSGMGSRDVPVGLDMVAVKVVLDAYGVALDEETMTNLQLIERAILREYAEGTR